MLGVIVRQKTKGRGQPWWVFINHQGKRKSVKVGSKVAANKVAAEIEARLKGGSGIERDKNSVPTLKQYFKHFMETYSKANHKLSTAERYRSLFKLHIIPALGDLRLDEIQKPMLKSFIYKKQASGLSAGTVKLVISFLGCVLNEAVDDEVIGRNPASHIRKYISKTGATVDPDPLTAEELNNLLETVKKHNPEHYPLLLLLSRTGMRVGEALGLDWGDVDFNGRFIQIERSFGRGRLSTTKGKRIRKVDMTPQLAAALEVHRTTQKRKRLSLGIGGDPQEVFTNSAGTRRLGLTGWRRRVFFKMLTKAKLRHRRIHDLRHTYATLRIASGHNISDVSNQLGHHSVKLTLDVYNHWLPGQNKSEVDSLDNLHLTPHHSAPYTHPTPKTAVPENV